MDISMFLAQAFGLYLVIAGIAFLSQPKVIDDLMDLFTADRAAVMLGGFITLVVGIPLVLVHNTWGGPAWQTLVTLLVWLTFLKGVLRVFAPGAVISWSKSMVRNPGAVKAMMAVMVLLGLYLCYVGFGFGM